jgi:hypothetical protein
MGSRGRKSGDELVLAPVVTLNPLPRLPAFLTPEQGDIWRVVIASRAGDLIAPETHPVLVEYCRAVTLSDDIAEEVNAFKPEWRKTDDGLKRWKTLLKMACNQAMVVASLSVKLRLAPSTRIQPITAGRNAAKGEKHKPWVSGTGK